MSADDPLEALARSVLEGADIDWDLVEAGAGEDGGAGRVRALRELARIVAFNRALQREESGPLAEDGPEPESPGPAAPRPPEDAQDAP